MKLIFHAVMFACSLGAFIVYAVDGDWRRCIYWAAAAVITAAVPL
jgi:hypothetical protein